MKNFKIRLAVLLLTAFIFQGCASMNKTQKGAAVGTAAGGGMGAIVGNATGNTALGAIIGAAVGGTAGALIGKKMDKQAEEIKNTVPDAKVERVGEGIVVEFSSNVLFGFDETNLSNQSKSSLDKLVKVLNTYKDTDIELQGHTDSKGSLPYNQNLSEERATSVSEYLSSAGISYQRMTIQGFGETVPKYDNNTESGRSENRRVEFLITANEKMQADAERDAAK
jgi:outer membrane protein OmpA-like peptidoglycan-associated protein